MSYESYLKKLLTEYYSNTGEEFNYEYHLDMTTAGLTKVLKGQVKNPSLSTIQKLAEYKNQDPTEIVRDMFFKPLPKTSNNYKKDPMWIAGNAAQHYLCKLYLNGYNIEPNDNYQIWDEGDFHNFAGVATKKRQPNNKIHVISVQDFFSDSIDQEENATTLLVWILRELVTNKEINKIKRIDMILPVVLDPTGTIVNQLETIKLPLKFKMNIAYYDHKRGKIIKFLRLS
ncbi:MAG: hypothetical protein IKU28_08450 [Erysipelotrichaceae bacterium]|nr:hypothetical protein [Erysipelotrichaceae bacterium]